MATAAVDLTHPPVARRRSRLPWIIAAVVLLVAVVVAVVLTGTRPTTATVSAENLATFEVRRGPLVISALESGTIKSREQVVIKNEVEGRVTILTLIPEGTRAHKGQLLVELDASKLVDQKVDQSIQVQNAYANMVRAKENLEVAKNQALSDVQKADLDYEFAKLNLQKYLKGEYPEALQAAEASIKLAEADLERAADTLNWSLKLAKDGYITANQLEQDKLEKSRKEVELGKSKTRLSTLQQFEHVQKIKELESNVEQTRLALERVKRKASADVVQAEADQSAKESEYNRQKDKLEKLDVQIGKTKLYAPTDGLVVYATTGQQGFRSTAEPLDEGQEVRERQELIYLPTANSMMAAIKLHESSLDKVRIGLPVRITVDALPGRMFWGSVARIAPLPDAQSSFMNPDLKVYNTEIHIEGETADLRTGMSCTAEIIVEEHASAFSVPVQSVVRIGKLPHVYVLNDESLEARPVKIGKDNNRVIHVLEGVKDGDRILLSPPLEAGDTSSDKNVELSGRKPEPMPANGPAGPAPGDNGAPRTGGADLKNLSPEERKKRFEAMSPEEREALKQRYKGKKTSGAPAAGPIGPQQ